MNRIIYKKIANKLNLPINKVQEVYTYYWKFYKDTLKEMPLRTDITKEEFWDSKYEETSRIEKKENKVLKI